MSITRRLQTIAALLGLGCATVAHAQQPTVPKLVRFSGSFHPASGTPAQTMEGVTLLVYRDQTGGGALWHETQNVVVDSDGHYSVLMGATLNEGMPVDLFASGEPRWLGVQFNRPGESEQPRVLLVSVPYALKAADAETLGGKPASAYLLAAPTVGADTHEAIATASTPVKPTFANPANSGSPNYIGKFANTTDLVNSSMYEVNGNVGIFTTTPLISLDVRTGALPQMGIAGKTDYLTFFASDKYGPAIYWDPALDMRFGTGGVGLYNPYGFVEQMRIQSSTGYVGIGTQQPVSMLDVAGDINLGGFFLFQGDPAMTFFDNNVGVGVAALPITSGQNNVAVGAGALMNTTTASDNIAIGYLAGSAFTVNNSGNSGNIDIGNTGTSSDHDIIRIGGPSHAKFFAAGIRGITTGNNNAVPVLIDSAGQLGTVSSSRRFKEDIEDMGGASHDLMRLRPVTFRYKEPFADGSKPIQYGLIAEEVAEVYPDLVAHSADGQIETVKYQVLDSMLLNEVQRQQDRVQRLERENQSLQERLNKMEEALASLRREL